MWYPSQSVWKTRKGLYGAKDRHEVVKYFKDEEKAQEFAQEYVWKTRKGNYGAENRNGARRYFKDEEKAKAFTKNTTTKPRDYHAERYERRRRQFLADPSAGHLGWIAPELFGPPPVSNTNQ